MIRLPQENEAEDKVPTYGVVKVGDDKGAKTIRVPPVWNRVLGWLEGKIPLKVEKCEWCTDAEGEDVFHLYVFPDNGKPAVCTETLMICPCGCGNKFRYNEREQRQLLGN